jgi:hypothetical protein
MAEKQYGPTNLLLRPLLLNLRAACADMDRHKEKDFYALRAWRILEAEFGSEDLAVRAERIQLHPFSLVKMLRIYWKNYFQNLRIRRQTIVHGYLKRGTSWCKTIRIKGGTLMPSR